MLIGITGLARSGKDTVADYLVDEYGFEKRGLADVIKQVARIVFGLSDCHLYGDKKDEIDSNLGTSPRKLLQVIGTEMFQNKLNEEIPEYRWGKLVWVKSLLRGHEPTKKLVIPDVRFDHEAKEISNFSNSFIWKVIRDKKPKAHNDSHISEKGINEDFVDFFLLNDAEIKDIYPVVDSIMETIDLWKPLI